MFLGGRLAVSGVPLVIEPGCKKWQKKCKNIQQRGFASGHPPNY